MTHADVLACNLGPLNMFLPHQPRVVLTPRGNVIVYRESPSEIHVWLGICPHMGNHFHQRDCTGAVIECSMHQWQFDLRKGKNLDANFSTPLTRIEFTIENGHLIAHIPALLD